MKRFFSVVILVLLTTALAMARPADARLLPVRAAHQRARHHHAHKAGKHHHPKRPKHGAI